MFHLIKFDLITTKILVTYWNFIEFFRVVIKYYKDFDFFKLDFYFWRSYLLVNPYQLSKDFVKKKRGLKEVDSDNYGDGYQDDYEDSYGETPLTTMEVIVSECGVSAHDYFYELGCGRGRTCFWIHHFIGCHVIGIEYIPLFVKIANSIVLTNLKTNKLKFICQDILEVDYSKATVVYFYGTCSEDSFILQLVERLKMLPIGAKIVTISYPITDYICDQINSSNSELSFVLIKSFPVSFPWGTTDAYLVVRV